MSRDVGSPWGLNGRAGSPTRASERRAAPPASDGLAAPNSRYAVESVSRAIALLRCFAETGSLLLEQAAALTGVSKSTAYRLLDTLQAAGLVERHPNGGYRTGPEAVRWGLLFLGQVKVPSVAADLLRQLWLETRETVVLALLTGSRIVLTEILESPAPFRMAEVPGTVVPLHASALGKAVAAHLDDQSVAEMVGPEPLASLTPNTVGTLRDFERTLRSARERGYADEVEESAIGVACVAAPVFSRGEVAGAIGVAGPRARMSDDRIAELGSKVRAVATEVSRRLSPLTA
ncbi:MAG: IclR family transcriptional regulator [Chloroflexota bacterium]